MTQSIIELQNLRRDYFEVRAVNDVNLPVPTGEILGLIGPNGAGKTTILRMLATTLEPTDGRIFFLGKDVWSDPVSYRRQIGFMPDFFQMYRDLKVWELLTYFGVAHGIRGRELAQRVDQVIQLIGLQEKRDSLCKGLSRGMVQRLGLGRAILHRPRLLLLDEPASGLDPLARRTLFEALRQIHAEGATILISSHILAELSDLCTYVGIMDRGCFLAVGPTRQVVQQLLPQRRMELRVLPDSIDPAEKMLREHEMVSNPSRQEASFAFEFSGSDEDLADLNRRMVTGGVRLVLLQESATSLHEAYFAIAKGQPDASA